MSFKSISFKEARQHTSQNKYRNFSASGDGRGGAERLSLNFPEIHHRPKFTISRSDVFFTIGSCFARNLEKQLSNLGVENITSKVVFDDSLYEKSGIGARNGPLNAYTPKSMLDLLRLTKRQDSLTAGIVQTGDDEYFDMMTSGLRGLTKQESVEVREKLLAGYRSLESANVAVVTLGYTETWLDNVDNIHTNRSPGGVKKLMQVSDRYSFFNDNPVSTVETVEEIIREIREQTNGRAKIVLTTSPVPLHSTWRGDDVICANSYSKSTLVSAANYVASKFDFVDYFPSYELATNAPRALAWKADGVHILPEFVKKIIGSFSEMYFE